MLQNLGKYVIIINEERHGYFRIYHFDYRGSTVAITNAWGCIEATFEYDTYGKETKSEGDTSNVIFRFNGRDGVITDIHNGLLYMRARYYSPELRRFVNADIISGEISNAVTLNRYAYANGNPVSNVDPFGLSAERGMAGVNINHNYAYYNTPFYNLPIEDRISIMERAADIKSIYDEYDLYRKYGYNIYRKGTRAYVIGGKKANLPTTYRKSYYDIPKISKTSNVDDYWDILKNVDVPTGLKSELSLFKPSGKINGGAVLNYACVALDVGIGIAENIKAGTDTQRIITDAVVDAGVGVGIIAGSTAIVSAVGSVVPLAGNIIGAGVGFAAGVAIDWAVNTDIVGDKSLVDLAKDGVDAIADGTVELVETIGDFFEDAENAIGGFFSGLIG